MSSLTVRVLDSIFFAIPSTIWLAEIGILHFQKLLLILVKYYFSKISNIIYRIEMYLNDNIIKDIDNILLGDGQKWDEEVIVKPVNVGDGQQLKLMLFKGENSQLTYNPLLLKIDVK